MSVPIRTSTVLEGTTTLVVPEQDAPTKFPTFFNPRGRFVRDVSIACYKAFALAEKRNDLVFADSLAGSGARGIRVANEAKDFSSVIINDIQLDILESCKKICRTESRRRQVQIF